MSLPSSVRSVGWPNLPRRRDELGALSRLVHRESDQYRSFVVALLYRKGPQERSRAELFREYVAGSYGESVLAKTANAVASLESRVARLNSNLSRARGRLLRYVTSALKQAGSGPKREDIVALLRTLGKLYRIAPEPKATESAELLQIVLTRGARGHEFHERIENVISLWEASDFPVDTLRAGWAWQKIPIARREQRDRLTADVIAYACWATAPILKTLQTLLTLVLPPELPLSAWVTAARARLKSLDTRSGELSTTAAIASAIDKLPDALRARINPDLFQDLSTDAVSQLAQAFEGCASYFKALSAEIEDLKSPETIRAFAGQLIREEVEREHTLLGNLQRYAQEQRMAVATRLSESFEQAEVQSEKRLSPALENAIRAAISFLQGKD